LIVAKIASETYNPFTNVHGRSMISFLDYNFC